MKMFFVETNGFNMVAVSDGSDKMFVMIENNDIDFSCLDVVKNTDFSGLDGCKNVNDMLSSIDWGEIWLVKDVENVAESIIEFVPNKPVNF